MHNEDAKGLAPQVAASLRHFIYGLYFLSLGDMDQPQGMLVSWVSQVSGSPPLLLASVRENRSILPGLKTAGLFALHLLPPGGSELLGLLARPAQVRFNDLSLQEGPLGLPLVTGALGALCCRIREITQPGDHALIVGEVAEAVWQGPGPALAASVGVHAYLGLS